MQTYLIKLGTCSIRNQFRFAFPFFFVLPDYLADRQTFLHQMKTLQPNVNLKCGNKTLQTVVNLSVLYYILST